MRDIAAEVGISKSAIDRHKRGCLEPELAAAKPIEGELQTSNEIVASEPARPITKNGRKSPLDDYQPLYEINSPERYFQYAQWLQDQATQAVSDSGDNIRLRLTAIKECRDNATQMAKARGWIKDSPDNDNRSINIFGDLTPEKMLAMRDALLALNG